MVTTGQGACINVPSAAYRTPRALRCCATQCCVHMAQGTPCKARLCDSPSRQYRSSPRSEPSENPALQRRAHSHMLTQPFDLYGREADVDVMLEAKGMEKALLFYR